MLNMDKWVTPNDFVVENFEQFGNMTPDAEFDLIAPVLVYFQADLMYKKQARAALKKLKALNHPMTADKTIDDMLETQPDGLDNRYNALIMAIVADAAPSAQAYIDEWGAFGFKHGEDTCALSGDASGFFAFYLSAKDVRERFDD